MIATKSPSGQVDETLSRIREDCEDSLRLLTGRFVPGHRFQGRDQRTRYRAENLEFILHAVEDLKSFAIRSPFTELSHVALKFALQHEDVSTMIVGAQTKREVLANMDAVLMPEPDPKLIEKLRRRYEKWNDCANYS